MVFKKLVSGIASLAIAGSMFAGLAVTAGAEPNASDTNVFTGNSFDSYETGNVTVGTISSDGTITASTGDGLSFFDATPTQIPSMSTYVGSGEREKFTDFSIKEDSGNKYIEGTLTANNNKKTGFFDTGALRFGGRDGSKYTANLGTTYVAEFDMRTSGAVGVLLTDQTNSAWRSGYKNYLDLTYDGTSSSNNASWKDEDNFTENFTMTSGEWHSIVLIDVVGSEFVTGTGVTHTATLYVDNVKIGTHTITRSSDSNGANNISNLGFLASTTTAVTIDLDNVYLYKLSSSSENSVTISLPDGADSTLELDNSETSIQLTGSAVHNTTDNIPVDEYFTPTWSLKTAVSGVSVSADGLVSVDTNSYSGGNQTATVVYTVGGGSAEQEISITSSIEQVTTPQKLQINYKLDDTVVAAADSIDVSTYSTNDTYSYYAPAYVEGTGDYAGKLYKVSSNYDRSATLVAGTTTVNETVTLETEGTYQYAEYDGDQVYVANERSGYASNGEVKRSNNIDILTVAEDGTYTINFANGPGSNATNNRTFTLTVGDRTIRTGSNGFFVWVDTFSNVSLKKGDVIHYGGSSGSCAVDYILIEKTGDYAEYTVTIDGTETKYPSGTIITLPEETAKDGYTAAGTYNDGAYKVGDSVTVTSDLTFTGDYTKSASVGTLTQVEFGGTLEGAAIDDNGVLTYNDSKYYAYKSVIDSCSGTAMGTFVGTDGTTGTVKSSTTITSSDTVIYVIANAELDTNQSSIKFE